MSIYLMKMRDPSAIFVFSPNLVLWLVSEITRTSASYSLLLQTIMVFCDSVKEQISLQSHFFSGGGGSGFIVGCRTK